MCCKSVLVRRLSGSVLLAISLINAALCIFLITYVRNDLLPSIILAEVTQMEPLLPGHVTYNQWVDPPVSLYKDIYFFNLTNPEDFAAGAKPNFTQIGPYCYREYRLKHPIGLTGNPGDSEVLYNQQKLFYFDSDRTSKHLSESDLITTINFPLVGAIAVVDDMNIAMKGVLKEVASLYHQKAYLTGDVHSMVWNYTNPFLQALHLDKKLLPSAYFSIQLNDSIDDRKTSKVYTGKGDISRLGTFIEWDGHSSLSWWPGADAQTLKGTEGLFFHPILKEGESLCVFVDDVMRSFQIDHTSYSTVMGISAFRYEVASHEFKGGLTYPYNGHQFGSWCPDGLIYMGVTQTPVVPVYASKPHFLDGDPSLVNNVIGLHPDRSLHDTSVEVEPTSGTNLRVVRQLQINFQVNRSSFFTQYKNMRNNILYFPMLYVNEHGQVSDSDAELLKEMVIYPTELVYGFLWGLVALTGFLTILFFVLSVLTCAGACRGKRCTRKVRRRSDMDEHWEPINENTPLLTSPNAKINDSTQSL